MFGIGGYQPNLTNMAGIYSGMMVIAGGAANTVRVQTGLAIVGKALVEVTPAMVVDLAVSVAADGEQVVYVNAPGAKDSTGAALSTLSVNKKEADTSHTNINGTVGSMQGRSIPLARITVAGGAITKIDNTERMKLVNIPAAMVSKSYEDTSTSWT